MAIVLLASRYANDGKIVDVMEFFGDGTVNGKPHANIWLVSIAGQTTNPYTGIPWAVPDAYLLPIRPGDLGETEETEKTLEFSE